MYEQPTKHHSSQQTYTTILSFFGCGMQSMGPATTRNDDLFIVILILAHAAHQSSTDTKRVGGSIHKETKT
jgi:hypothetical protein